MGSWDENVLAGYYDSPCYTSDDAYGTFDDDDDEEIDCFFEEDYEDD